MKIYFPSTWPSLLVVSSWEQPFSVHGEVHVPQVYVVDQDLLFP